MNNNTADKLIAAYNRFSEMAMRAPKGRMAMTLEAFALTMACASGNPSAMLADDAEREARTFGDLAERAGLSATLAPLMGEMLDACALARFAALSRAGV